MNKYHKFIVILISALLLHLISCNNLVKKGITEGEIIFDIEYLDNERENPLIALLPRKMVTVFKDNSSYSNELFVDGCFVRFWADVKADACDIAFCVAVVRFLAA